MTRKKSKKTRTIDVLRAQNTWLHSIGDAETIWATRDELGTVLTAEPQSTKM